MNSNVKTYFFDGHCQTVVKLGAVEFIFGNGRLLTVACDKWPFGINFDGSLANTGGWPLTICDAMLQAVPDAVAQNELFEMAKVICTEELAKYLASPDYANHLELHRIARSKREPEPLVALAKKLAAAMTTA